MKIKDILQLGIILFISCTIGSCEKTCMQTENCQLEPESGLCQAAFLRYYYNPETESCEPFTWGGCGGVVPFETLEECEAGCGCD